MKVSLSSKAKKMKDAAVSGGLSFVIPGVGQIRNGNVAKGCLQLGGAIALGTVAGPIGFAASTALAGYSAIDAAVDAVDAEQETDQPQLRTINCITKR